MVIDVLGSPDEYERQLIKERTALKCQSSRANGTKFGRPKSVNDSQHIATAGRMNADGHTAKNITRFLGVSRATRSRSRFHAMGPDREWILGLDAAVIVGVELHEVDVAAPPRSTLGRTDAYRQWCVLGGTAGRFSEGEEVAGFGPGRRLRITVGSSWA